MALVVRVALDESSFSQDCRIRHDLHVNLANPVNSVKVTFSGATHLNLYLPAAATVFHHTLYQCRLTVLDSTADRKNSVTTLGRDSRGLEYMPTFFSDDAADRIRLCPRFSHLAQPAGTSGSTRTPHILDCDLPFPVAGARTGSNRFTTGKPDIRRS